jgi:uncharacterized protein (TIGR02996 family)
MTQRDSFLHAIYENPDDVALRLVFADWLEDQGDPLGEFIRVQCELDQGVEGGQFDELCRRESELLQRHRQEWLGAAALLDQLDHPYDHAFTFSRGLPESVYLPVGGLVEHADLLAACPTVYRAGLFEVRGNGAALAECAALRRFRAIEIADWIWPQDAFLFATSSNVAGLESLTIWLGNRDELAVWEPVVFELDHLRHVSLVQLWGGRLAQPYRSWTNARADTLAARFNEAHSAPIAVVERPFDRHFPLDGDLTADLYAGRQHANRLALAGVRYHQGYVTLAHFDSQGDLIGEETRSLRGVFTRKPEHEGQLYHPADVLDFLKREIGFELDLIHVKEFATAEMGVELWGTHYVEYIANPDAAPDEDEDRRQAGVNLLGWLSSGNFSITFGNQMWAGDNGKIHTT